MTKKMDVNMFKQLADRMSSKYETTLQVNSTTSEFNSTLVNEIVLKSELTYKIAVTQFAVFNFPQIINATNNNIYYTKTGGIEKQITFTPGAYTHIELNAVIQATLTSNGDWEETNKGIVIGTDDPSGRFIITVGTGFSVNFTRTNTLRVILGFNSRVLSTGVNVGDSLGNVEGGIQTINIVTDISNGGYISNKNNELIQRGVIFTIPFLSVAIGARIVEVITNPKYYVIKDLSMLKSFYVRIEDQTQRLIHFGGQNITIEFHIKQV